MSTANLETIVPTYQGPQYVRLPTVMSITGLGKSSVYWLISQGSFPKQHKLGKRASGWLVSDLEAWAASRQQVA